MIKRSLLLVLLWLGTAGSACAETYRVDLIVFLDLYRSGGESGDAAQPANIRGAIDANDAGSLRAAGIEVLPDEQFGLVDEWQHLRYSKQFKPLVRLAWTQKDPPGERGPSLRIRPVAKSAGEAAGSASVDGSVALLLGRYLHLDSALQYSEDGLVWPLNERRKMRRDEVHHLDSPRLGILARVTKAEAAAP